MHNLGCLIQIIEQYPKYVTIQASIYKYNSYSELDGILVFRKYVLEGNPFQAGGIYKLESNPLTYMDQNRYNRIYDSNTVIAYEK